MAYLPSNAIALDPDRASFINADEVTEGDIIRHFTGDTWQVITEPEYTNQGITFDVMWLDVDTDNTQSVTFAPNWRFELVNYQPVAKVEAA